MAFPGVQLLDLAGPADVFSAAGEVAQAIGAAPSGAGYRVVVASSEGGLVKATCGVAIDAVPLASVRGDIDTVVIAGGTRAGVEAAQDDPVLQRWFVAAAHRSRRFGSVCSGAFLLAKWGLLEGRRVATHWSLAKTLQRRHEGFTVEPDALYVQDGRVWTSGGVTAGIDMSLSMVEGDHGRETASLAARHLVLSVRRLGNQSQYSRLLTLESGRYAELIVWMRAHLDEPLGVDRLAERVSESPRSFHRHFEAETGETPAVFVETLRLEVAKAELEAGASVKAAARAAGLTSDEHLSRVFRRRLNMTPLQYQAVHAT